METKLYMFKLDVDYGAGLAVVEAHTPAEAAEQIQGEATWGSWEFAGEIDRAGYARVIKYESYAE